MESLVGFTGSALPSVVAFVWTAALLVEIGATAVFLLWRGHRLAARWVATSGVAVAGTYLAILGGVSLASGGWTVEMGGSEHVCASPTTTPSAEVRAPALLTESTFITRLLIGHERSLPRARTVCRLDESTSTSHAGTKP